MFQNVFVFVLLLFTELLQNTCGEEKLDNVGIAGNTKIAPPLFYRDLGSILKFFDDPQRKASAGVQELLTIYRQNREKIDQLNITEQSKKHPLFVLEGLAGSGKTTLGAMLSKRIGSVQIHSPTFATNQLKLFFQHDNFLETAYNAMSHYISALEVLAALQISPVIMDRFWHSSASYWIAHAVNAYPKKYKMPPKGDIIYTWPQDLLKPDQVFLLELNEELRMQRISGRVQTKNITIAEVKLHNLTDFRNNILLAYKNMDSPEVTLINDNLTAAEVVEDIYLRLKHLLKN